MLAELDAATLDAADRPKRLKTYTWGLDLSHSRDGAAGIGGLLAVYDTNGTVDGETQPVDDKLFVYCYDGNGNVTQLVDWRDTAVSPNGDAWDVTRLGAMYEYDPIGNVVTESGYYAASHRWRFSTRTFDASTIAGSWAYRSYNAMIGRWLSRDALDEHDSPLLYSMTHNNAISQVDSLGLQAVPLPVTPDWPIPQIAPPPVEPIIPPAVGACVAAAATWGPFAAIVWAPPNPTITFGEPLPRPKVIPSPYTKGQCQALYDVYKRNQKLRNPCDDLENFPTDCFEALDRMAHARNQWVFRREWNAKCFGSDPDWVQYQTEASWFASLAEHRGQEYDAADHAWGCAEKLIDHCLCVLTPAFQSALKQMLSELPRDILHITHPPLTEVDVPSIVGP